MAIRFTLTILGFSAWTFLARAADLSAADKWPAELLHEESWVIAKTVDLTKVDGLIYGNKQVGFFALRPEWDGRKIRARFFPPGYRHPIEFYLRLRGQVSWVKLGTRKYASPFVRAGWQAPERFEGHFTYPFIVTHWNLAGLGDFPVIFNSRGEMVWAMVAKDGKRTIVAPSLQKISGSEYALLGQNGTALIETLNVQTGEVVRQFKDSRWVFHHAFQYFPQTEEAVAVAFDCRELGYREEFAPVFSGLSGLWNLLTLPRRTYAGGSLVKVNLVTGQSASIWNTRDHFDPKSTPNLAKVTYNDRFQNAKWRRQYMTLMRTPRYTMENAGFNCSEDWSHENSVSYRPEYGYLVSARNLNRIILVGEDGRFKWSLGADSSNDYVLDPADGLELQHDAVWMGNAILTYDNRGTLRGAESAQGEPNQIKRIEFKDHKAWVSWRFDLPRPPSALHGSVNVVGPERIFAYQSGAGRAPVRFFEIDTRLNAIVGMIGIRKGAEGGRAVQARPLAAIADEKYLAPEVEAPRLASQVQPWDDFGDAEPPPERY